VAGLAGYGGDRNGSSCCEHLTVSEIAGMTVVCTRNVIPRDHLPPQRKFALAEQLLY
jgi:hypothetical protein